MTGALHDLQLMLSPPLPSSLASIKRLTQVHLEKWQLKWRENVMMLCDLNVNQ